MNYGFGSGLQFHSFWELLWYFPAVNFALVIVGSSTLEKQNPLTRHT